MRSPLVIDTTSSPWAIRPPNGVLAVTHTSSVWSGLKSPDTPAKLTMSASVTVRPNDRQMSPTFIGAP